MIQMVGNALVIISAVLCWVFVVLYHVLTGGDWSRRSAVGRHLMVSMATFGAVLTLTAVRVVVGATASLDTGWFLIVRTVVFGFVPVMFAWRIWLLLRAQRDRDKEGQE